MEGYGMIRNFRVKYRILSFVAVFVLVFSSVPATSAAVGGKCGDDLYWSFDNNVLTISGTGEMYDFIQKTPQNKPGEPPWRLYDTKTSKIIIGEGCENVGEYAFYGFSPLTTIVFPKESLKKIGAFSFSRCTSLASVKLPDSIVFTGKEAFSRCTSLKSVDFGNSSASIAKNMFSEDSALTSVALSPNCREICSYAFNACTSLKVIDLTNIELIESFSFQKCPLTSVSFGKGLKYAESSVFYGCSSLTEINFDETAEPDCINNMFLSQTPYYTALPSGLYTMFDGKVLMYKGTYTETSLEVEEGIQIIADGAFSGASKLVSVSFPSTLKTIGTYAFGDCKKLTSVFIPSTVENLYSNCLGKMSDNMSYVNLDGFTLYSKGCAAAIRYASDEAIAYVCEHDFDYLEERSSCDKAGYIKRVCRWCGACTEKTPIAPGEHEYETTVVKAGCESDGYTLRHCKVCGAEEKTDPIPALGHIIPGEWSVVSLPSCSEQGEISALCERCGTALNTVFIEKTAHIARDEYVTEIAPTCLDRGTVVKTCTVCNAVLDRKYVDAAGHIPDKAAITLTLPSEDGTLCGCRATICSVCREVLSSEWTDINGKSIPDGAVSALTSVRSVMLCEADINIASIDYNLDGAFNVKDIKALASLVK